MIQLRDQTTREFRLAAIEQLKQSNLTARERLWVRMGLIAYGGILQSHVEAFLQVRASPDAADAAIDWSNVPWDKILDIILQIILAIFSGGLGAKESDGPSLPGFPT